MLTCLGDAIVIIERTVASHAVNTPKPRLWSKFLSQDGEVMTCPTSNLTVGCVSGLVSFRHED